MKYRKKKKNVSLIIIILVLLVGCFIYYNFFSKKSQSNLVNNIDSGIKFQKIEKEEINTIINRELYILDDKSALNEITNQEKLWLARTIYYENDKTKIFTPSDLENSFNGTSIYYLGIKHENISCYGIKEHPALYLYDSKSNSYSENPNHGAHGIERVSRLYSKIIDIKEENNKYTVNCYNFFTISSEGTIIYNVYGSYEDATNKTNILGTIDISNTTVEKAMDSFYKQNDKNFKNKVTVYTYKFEKTANKIKLIDFSKK